jgi:hypothetical protein
MKVYLIIWNDEYGNNEVEAVCSTQLNAEKAIEKFKSKIIIAGSNWTVDEREVDEVLE